MSERAARGYYISPGDLTRWLNRAQRASFVKNKVRKELYDELMDVVFFTSSPNSFRISSSQFIAIQTFCMIDGKGQDTMSSDQILNFATSLNQLRQELSEHMHDIEEVSESAEDVSS